MSDSYLIFINFALCSYKSGHTFFPLVRRNQLMHLQRYYHGDSLTCFYPTCEYHKDAAHSNCSDGPKTDFCRSLGDQYWIPGSCSCSPLSLEHCWYLGSDPVYRSCLCLSNKKHTTNFKNIFIQHIYADSHIYHWEQNSREEIHLTTWKLE